jgi:hypothetical protein
MVKLIPSVLKIYLSEIKICLNSIIIIFKETLSYMLALMLIYI